MEAARLKTFRVVSEMLSFRKAANYLHLTQPAVTAQIKGLETSLGVALFHRIGRDVSLTPAGETLLVYARRIEKLTNQAAAALNSCGADEEIEISVGASFTLAVHFLPKVLPQLLKSWPKLRIHIIAGSTSEILQAVSTHRVSLGFIEAPAFRPDLQVEAFGHDELTLIVPSGHRWAKKQSVSPSELVKEPILLREPGSGMRRFVEEFLEKSGVRPELWAAVDMNSTEALVAMVEAGVGVAFVSYLAVEKALATGSVHTVAIEGGPILRNFSLVLPKGPIPRGPVQELVELAKHAPIPKPGHITPHSSRR